MAKIIVAAPPVTGELSPLLQLARDLAGRGHQITVVTGSRFRADVENAGLGFTPVTGLADYDDRLIGEDPERAKLGPGPEMLNYDWTHAFVNPMPDHDINERTWNPAMPLLFQRLNGLERQSISAGGIRDLIRGALASSGITGTDGQPLDFRPHDFRRIFTTDAKMGRIASDATFPERRDCEAVGDAGRACGGVPRTRGRKAAGQGGMRT